MQRMRRFWNFNQSLSKVFEHLVKKGLLRPLSYSKPPNPNVPDYDPNSYCKFHKVIGHSTNTFIRLKNEIQNLIDARIIIDPESPFPSYNTMIINSWVSEEEVLNSFENLNLEPIEKSPDALGDTKKTKKLVAPSYLQRGIEEEVIKEVTKEMQE